MPCLKGYEALQLYSKHWNGNTLGKESSEMWKLIFVRWGEPSHLKDPSWKLDPLSLGRFRIPGFFFVVQRKEHLRDCLELRKHVNTLLCEWACNLNLSTLFIYDWNFLHYFLFFPHSFGTFVIRFRGMNLITKLSFPKFPNILLPPHEFSFFSSSLLGWFGSCSSSPWICSLPPFPSRNRFWHIFLKLKKKKIFGCIQSGKMKTVVSMLVTKDWTFLVFKVFSLPPYILRRACINKCVECINDCWLNQCKYWNNLIYFCVFTITYLMFSALYHMWQSCFIFIL